MTSTSDSPDARLDALAPTLDELVRAGRIAGWVAGVRAPDDQAIGTGGRLGPGRGPMREDTPFALSSNSKPLAGALTLRLAELDVLALDDPVARWVPELSRPRVLRAVDGPLEDTVPAEGPITVTHLLTMTPGLGWVAEPGPLAEAMQQRHLAPGPFAPPMDPDAYIAALADLPLADQPGASWRYHTSTDVLAVLLQRATGRSVTDLLTEHLTGPLDMTGTAFTGDRDRMPTVLEPDESGDLVPSHVPEGAWSDAPAFESLATGLVSTAGDQLAFLGSLVGSAPPVLTAESVRAMRTDHLTGPQRESAAAFLDDGCGWGLHVEVRPGGRFGWAGGLGTIGYADPATGRAAFLGTQATVGSPGTIAAIDAFWSLLG